MQVMSVKPGGNGSAAQLSRAGSGASKPGSLAQKASATEADDNGSLNSDEGDEPLSPAKSHGGGEDEGSALVAELTQDYHQRTNFLSFRVAVGWWGGLTACTATISGSGDDLLKSIMNAPLVRCDVAPWSLFGISLAGYNFLLSLGGAVAILGMTWRNQKP